MDSPNTAKTSELFTSSTELTVGSSGMQGWRMEMEDAHIAMDMPSKPNHTFVAVFDGHGGAGAALFAGVTLVTTLEQTSEWKEYLDGGAADPHLLGKAMAEAFLQLDTLLRTRQAADSVDSSGCTSVTAMITPTHIVCANAGDSRCVLGTNGMAKALSEDHKPTDEQEKNRIEAAGGRVQWKRVDGDLAVSRAFGDFQYKSRFDLGPKDQKVTCYPDIAIHERTPEDEMLVLACDGLWDVVSSEEAAKTVREIFAEGCGDMIIIAEELLDIALKKGSKDNISAVVVRLPGATVNPAKPDSKFVRMSSERLAGTSGDGGAHKGEGGMSASGKLFQRFASFRGGEEA